MNDFPKVNLVAQNKQGHTIQYQVTFHNALTHLSSFKLICSDLEAYVGL